MAIFNEDISINSIIGKGSSIKGNLKINGFIRVDGDLDGDLETSGNVIIGENARVRGDIIAKSVSVIGGIVYGNIIAPDSVKLLSTSVVIGDIQTHKLQSDEKVILHGHCISLLEQNPYENAILDWQNKKAIQEKSIQV